MNNLVTFTLVTPCLVLINANNHQDIEEYCTNLVSKCNKDFTTKCHHRQYIIKNCCNLKIFNSPTGLYTIRREQFDTVNMCTVIWTPMVEDGL